MHYAMTKRNRGLDLEVRFRTKEDIESWRATSRVQNCLAERYNMFGVPFKTIDVGMRRVEGKEEDFTVIDKNKGRVMEEWKLE